jgi:hypothetical protein
VASVLQFFFFEAAMSVIHDPQPGLSAIAKNLFAHFETVASIWFKGSCQTTKQTRASETTIQDDSPTQFSLRNFATRSSVSADGCALNRAVT